MKSKKLKFLKGVLKVGFGGLCVMYYLGFRRKYLWHFLLLQLVFFKPWLLLSVPVSAFGASLTYWKDMAMTIRVQMLMCRKETQKNLIDSPTISVKKCLQMERTELYLSS